MAELTVITWRDIPAQVLARGAQSTSARTLLPEKFQEAIDAAAMVAGLTGSDEYGEHWTMHRRECGDDLQAEVDAEAARVVAEWNDSVLQSAIRAGGLRDGETAGPRAEA
jgi:tRNA C32,U32 (ribose-2'-O)-methylase TrmJ